MKTVALELRPLSPKTDQPNASQISLQVNRNPYPGTIMNDEEYRYFRSFCKDLAKGFGAPYHASIWERLIPQMGEVEPFIRHATVAIGALRKSHATMNQRRIPSKGSALVDPHYMFAIKAYCKALQGMRESMAQNRGDIKSALLASLLAFCFESLEGHEKAATSHAVGGSTLFHKWQKDHSFSDFMEVEDLSFAFSGLVSDIFLN